MAETPLAYADRVRTLQGYRTVSRLLADGDNIFIDPFSALISTHARIGTGNVFYPNVRIDAVPGTVRIGDNNRFFEGTRIDATGGGHVAIDSDNEFGPHAVTLMANRPGAAITIRRGVRLLGRIEVAGVSDLEDGSQILGDINAVNVSLAGGGSHREPDPDLRGAVLKGRGRATGIVLGRGQVINGDGDFAASPVEEQSVYHPRTAQL
jgi:acetyltransferase-like isoleucine patch superfamily enzyme